MQANLEIMVYIHGGFLQFGSGHQPGMRPSTKLAKKMNIVFVSFNYRLLALGFLALANNSNYSNFGLWDQIVALQWVQENIKYFGGDARQMTLFGADGGAAAILSLMTTNEAQNLFRSAWLIGPALYFNQTFFDASRDNGRYFLKRSGCHDASCLRSASPKQITEFFLGKSDPSFRIIDQNDLPIQGIFAEQLIVIDGKSANIFLSFETNSPLTLAHTVLSNAITACSAFSAAARTYQLESLRQSFNKVLFLFILPTKTW